MNDSKKLKKIVFKKAYGCSINVKKIKNKKIISKYGIIDNIVSNNIKTSILTSDNVISNNINIEKIKTIELITDNIITKTEIINNISLDTVINSINGFKIAIYNNYYMLSLVNKYKDEIIKEKKYNTVIQPIVEKSYLDFYNYFWIMNIPLEIQGIVDSIYYFSWKREFVSWNNLLINDIPDVKARHIIKDGMAKNIDVLNTLLKNPTYNNTYYKTDINPWLNGLILYMITCMPDVLNENKWIIIGSNIDLIKYFPIAIQNNPSLLPPEYIIFIQYINDTLTYLNSTNWKIEDVNNIWQLTTIEKLATAKCLLSVSYPNWTGKYVSECFIPNSNFDYPSIVFNIEADLNTNYPELTYGQFVISTYNIEKLYYVSLIQIIEYNGIKSFKEKQIIVNDFFKECIITNGDVLINGNLNVKTFDNTPIIETDNVNKIVSIHNKLGINQSTSEVKAMLDVDNISVDKFINIMDLFKKNQLNSYNVLDTIKSSIPNQEIPLGFTDIVIFKMPIKNTITSDEIIYTNRPNSGLLSKPNSKLSIISYHKIILLINEVNKMKPQLLNYYRINNDNLIYTFSEILDDEYNYLCSIRGYIYNDEMYFITSFLNIENIISDNSYNKNFIKIIGKISSANRFVNYSVLVFNIPEVNKKLFPADNEQPDSLTGYTAYIENGDFRNRFGFKNLYGVCLEFSPDIYVSSIENYNSSINYGSYLFLESNTSWNGKVSRDLFITNTDNRVNKAFYLIGNQMMTNYNFYLNNNFGVYYNWINGMKYSICYLFKINNKLYQIVSGIDLVTEIDNSILSRGDTVLVGDLTIRDNDNNPVFSVSNINNSISNIYNVGIGLTIPTTTLDVNDTPISEILNVIEQLGFYNYTINTNISKLINASSENDFKYIIETEFINPYTGLECLQNIDFFFLIQSIPENYNPNDISYIYIWAYPEWDNLKFKDIDDPQNKNIINDGLNAVKNYLKLNILFNNSSIYNIYNWAYGKKISKGIFFEYNNKLYVLVVGVNLQINNLRYNTNSNISKLFNCISTFQTLVQTLVAKIDSISLYNPVFLQPLQNLFNNLLLYDKPIINKYRIFSNKNKFLDSIINYGYDYNYRNIETNLPDLFSQIISYTPDVMLKDIYLNRNEYTKIISLIVNISKIYGINNTNPSLFNIGDYGIVYFEDEKEYYISLFYCYAINTVDSSFDIISVELNLSKIIIPTLKITGDSITYGEIASNANTGDHNFFTADPSNKFVGINSDDRKIFYDYVFNTEKKTFIKDQHVYIKNDKYPNLLCERVWESNLLDPVYVNQFKTFSSSTMKRTSDLYTFKEIDTFSKLEGSKYGTDIAFEFCENSGNSQEIGNIGMTMDSYDNDTKIIKGGFQVIAKEINKELDINNLSDKLLLYVDNDSQLSCNSVKTNNVKLECISVLPIYPVIGQMQYVKDNNNDYLYVCVSISPISWKKTLLT